MKKLKIRICHFCCIFFVFTFAACKIGVNTEPNPFLGTWQEKTLFWVRQEWAFTGSTVTIQTYTLHEDTRITSRYYYYYPGIDLLRVGSEINDTQEYTYEFKDNTLILIDVEDKTKKIVLTKK